MTRIISGFAGSLMIAVPASDTRPTSDRVREAIFSALDARDAIRGTAVLDLYAGSGALGLEAASRGAARVTLVEKSTSAAATCRKNAAVVLKSAPRVGAPVIQVSAQSVQVYLDAGGDTFDLVFLDPPYDLGEGELADALAGLVPRLAPDAIVMVERSSRSAEPVLPDGLELDKRKNYGDTTLWWLRGS
ncbi:16S rRNA (guanine966-N2)-methyltransferase [Marisediminicola sp. UYEF4]|uniref:16S rRNA (guanine(966)-N(2))-methyltransferase RsmD n=1 Tax=Marisediminicola sp. UYEF4 TaxID=1756384 RepID=UPI003394913F